MKNIFKEAHKLTKEMKAKYPEINYQLQFGLYVSYLLEKKEEQMKDLKGSEKQVKWAEDIRREFFRVYDLGASKMADFRQERVEESRKELEEIESAKWYIDNFSYILKEKTDYDKAFTAKNYFKSKFDDKIATKSEILIMNVFAKVQM